MKVTFTPLENDFMKLFLYLQANNPNAPTYFQDTNMHSNVYKKITLSLHFHETIKFFLTIALLYMAWNQDCPWHISILKLIRVDLVYISTKGLLLSRTIPSLRL